MENLIKKLSNVNKSESDWKKWSLEDKLQLLKIYYIICKNEKYIFDLIYNNHGCDSWEDIFRDYNEQYLVDKAEGVLVAIESLKEEIDETK
jgi:hypothetical protein